MKKILYTLLVSFFLTAAFFLIQFNFIQNCVGCGLAPDGTGVAHSTIGKLLLQNIYLFIVIAFVSFAFFSMMERSFASNHTAGKPKSVLKYWFKQKKYGYGVTPKTWEGWVTLIVFALITISGALLITNSTFFYAFLTTIVLAVVWLSKTKTKDPWEWRWG